MENIISYLFGIALFSTIILGIIYKWKKISKKNMIKIDELENRIMELEIMKQNETIKLLDEEIKQIDKILNERG